MISQVENKVVEILNKFKEPEEYIDNMGLVRREILKLKITLEELEKGLQERTLKIVYVGAYLPDDEWWTELGVWDNYEYNKSEELCEKNGYYYLANKCFDIKINDVVGLFVDEYRKYDLNGFWRGVVDYYYAIVKQTEKGDRNE